MQHLSAQEFPTLSPAEYITLIPCFLCYKTQLLLLSYSVVSNSVDTTDYAAHQAPPSMEFCRQDYWSGLPFPITGDLPDPGIKHGSPYLLHCRWILYHWATGEARKTQYLLRKICCIHGEKNSNFIYTWCKMLLVTYLRKTDQTKKVSLS